MSIAYPNYPATMPPAYLGAMASNGYAPVSALPTAIQPSFNPLSGMPYYQPIFTSPNLLPPSAPVQTAAGPLAQTLPLASLSNIPVPWEVAPAIFNLPTPSPSFSPPPVYVPPFAQNTRPYWPPQQPSYWPPQQPSYWPPQQPSYWPPQQPSPYPAAQNLADPSAPKPGDTAKPDANKPVVIPPKAASPGVSMDVIKSINGDLESSESSTRQGASIQLSRMIAADPDILSKPQYGPLIEALILKVLKDPLAVIRQPVLLNMQVGDLNQPTPKILAALNGLKGEGGLYNFEPDQINQIMAVFRQKSDAAQPDPVLPVGQAPSTSNTISTKPAAQALMPQRPRNFPATPGIPQLPGQRLNVMSA
jgi:hypothetical protein